MFARRTALRESSRLLLAYRQSYSFKLQLLPCFTGIGCSTTHIDGVNDELHELVPSFALLLSAASFVVGLKYLARCTAAQYLRIVLEGERDAAACRAVQSRLHDHVLSIRTCVEFLALSVSVCVRSIRRRVLSWYLKEEPSVG